MYFTENDLRFTEDLTAADKAVQKTLWPLINAAMKEGKKALFAGVHVIIKGREIQHTLSPLETQPTLAYMDTSEFF